MVCAFQVSNTFGKSQKQRWATSQALPASRRILDNGRVLVVLNRERLAVEVGRTNLHTFDTPPHIPGDRHRASGLHRRAILLNHIDRKSTRLNSSHGYISYAVFCLKKKKDDVHLTQILYKGSTPARYDLDIG